jgi:16S rRNA (guanine(966)-N(2))-methyltransferase RsmD
MRIIGGLYKGRLINPPKGYEARPTTDFAREGLFNVLDNEYEMDGLHVLDLFGGTGAVSFEFASRGVSIVYCVEMSRENSSFIKYEAERLGIKNVITVRDNVFDFLHICREHFDIVFADPPYAMEGLDSIPEKIFDSHIINSGGYFILEHPESYSFVNNPHFVKEKRYGRVHFSFFS